MSQDDELSEEFQSLRDVYDTFKSTWSFDSPSVIRKDFLSSEGRKDEPQSTTVSLNETGRCSPQNNSVDLSRLQVAAWKFGVYPSQAQIVEVHYTHTIDMDMRSLGFHEFCVLIFYIKLQLSKKLLSPLPRVKSRRSMSMTNCNVFLGGACNPTTWRHDVAIPYLKEHNISFYNPQVSCWNPKLIELEESAKQSSNVLLFVLDTRTRGIASLVEVAYLAGQGRNLVLVMPPNDATFTTVNGKPLPPEEVDSIQRAYFFIRDLLERCGYPIFTDLRVALRSVKYLVETGSDVRNLPESIGAVPVKHGCFNVGKCMTNLHGQFRSLDTNSTGTITHKEASIGLRVLLGHDFVLPKPVVSSQKSGKKNRTDENHIRYTFPQFCLLYAREVRRMLEVETSRGKGRVVHLHHSISHQQTGSRPEWLWNEPREDAILTRRRTTIVKQQNHPPPTRPSSTYGPFLQKPGSVSPSGDSGYSSTTAYSSCEDIRTGHQHHQPSPSHGMPSPRWWDSVKGSYRWLVSWLWPGSEGKQLSGMSNSLLPSPQEEDEDEVWLGSELDSPGPPGMDYINCEYDVYLGGSCGDSTWRQKVAEPLLMQAGVCYYNPQKPHTGTESRGNSPTSSPTPSPSSPQIMRLMPSEMWHREHSRVMLYVLTQETFATGSLVECAFYIGRQWPMVLHVEKSVCSGTSQVSSSTCLLSECALKDHQRGRSYLMAIANQQNIPVMDNVESAVYKSIDMNRRLTASSSMAAQDSSAFSFTHKKPSGNSASAPTSASSTSQLMKSG